MTWNEFMFVVAFCGSIYFIREMLHRAVTPDLVADIARRREQRMRRKAARRGGRL